ncbi:MAG: hypothetical protein GX130_09090 [Candidatus Hydrogenedens sp.]|jgi:hypothetical protein|nr:hypothetical protein [Candidatus Hydrogenedens sp.]
MKEFLSVSAYYVIEKTKRHKIMNPLGKTTLSQPSPGVILFRATARQLPYLFEEVHIADSARHVLSRYYELLDSQGVF